MLMGLFLPMMDHIGLKQPQMPSSSEEPPAAVWAWPGWWKGTLKWTWEGERTRSVSRLAGLRVRGSLLSSSR